MKKTLAAILASASAALSLAACSPEKSPNTYNIYMPDGAPAVALAAFMDGGYAGAEFTVVSSTTIAQRVSTGDADLAIMPINAAANLFNQGKDIVMLSVNTHGNLFIVGNSADDIELADLKGKKIGVIGEGNVPDLTLRMLLAESNVEIITTGSSDDKVFVQYTAAPLPLLQKGDIDYALMPEPAVTTAVDAMNKSIVADVQKLWQDTFGGEYPQACLVAKGSIVRSDEGKAFIDKFLADLKKQDDWAQNNPDKAVAAVNAHLETGTQPSLKSLTVDSVKRCNIKTVEALNCKAECETYFQKLTGLNGAFDKPVLSKVPSDEFYYKA